MLGLGWCNVANQLSQLQTPSPPVLPWKENPAAFSNQQNWFL